MSDVAVLSYTQNANNVHVNPCYSYHIKPFRMFQNERRLKLVPAVYEYFKALNDSEYKAGTIRMRRSAVKNMLIQASYKMTRDERYDMKTFIETLDNDPATKAPRMNTAAIGMHKVLTDDEYKITLSNCRSRKQHYFIKFLYSTGCRVSEITGIKLKNCKTEAGAVYIDITGKGRKQRLIRVPESLYREVIACFGSQLYLFETANGKPYSRSYISNQIKKITLKAIGRGLSAHCMRHTFITRQIKRTGMISAVSQYAGHSSISTTLSMYNHEELTNEMLFSDI